MVGCQVLAIDLRGHGDTVTTNEEDLSAETMARYLQLCEHYPFVQNSEFCYCCDAVCIHSMVLLVHSGCLAECSNVCLFKSVIIYPESARAKRVGA